LVIEFRLNNNAKKNLIEKKKKKELIVIKKGLLEQFEKKILWVDPSHS